MFADQERGVTGVQQTMDVDGRVDAAFGDFQDVGGHHGCEIEGGFEPHFEGAEIAVVDADDLRAGVERCAEFFRVVDFHERVHSILPGQLAEVAHFACGEDGGDQEDGVSSVGCGFDDVERRNGEVFSDGGQCDSGTRSGEIVETALEKVAVGEDREGGGSALLVASTGCGGVGSRWRGGALCWGRLS